MLAADDVLRWFKELELQGIRITDAQTGKKLREEAKEFVDDPCLEEAADCFIALLGAVKGAGWDLNQLAAAVTTKTAINRKRKWERQPDGTFHHVKEAIGGG